MKNNYLNRYVADLQKNKNGCKPDYEDVEDDEFN